MTSNNSLRIKVCWDEGIPRLGSTISLRSSDAVFLLMTPNMSLFLLVATSFSLFRVAEISRETGVVSLGLISIFGICWPWGFWRLSYDVLTLLWAVQAGLHTARARAMPSLCPATVAGAPSILDSPWLDNPRTLSISLLRLSEGSTESLFAL